MREEEDKPWIIPLTFSIKLFEPVKVLMHLMSEELTSMS